MKMSLCLLGKQAQVFRSEMFDIPESILKQSSKHTKNKHNKIIKFKYMKLLNLSIKVHYVFMNI